MTPAEMVREFHETFGLPVKEEPSLYAFRAFGQLRRDLITEEAHEFAHAVRTDDFVEAVDALADLVYVAYGAALTFGVDLDEVLAEVHRSNMTKRWTKDQLDDGWERGMATYECDWTAPPDTPRYVAFREDGKVLKPPTWEAPDIAGMVE